ncbi:hypothetical protein [Nitrosomonas ureae]|uniref:Uncharacterized protein n=1 Tax=Nitrosomonas ureae TaxID=44577 RepID=A0A2T5I7I9_9PROT|nr:hypothetical protein [Nitrosomonas ureae]PTQ79769.1 hypothetical protein C8R28_10459 [Nitrosomonas ureae]PXX09504.1 hypothetical protein C8R27_1365 [Nitrosomonas ureae]
MNDPENKNNDSNINRPIVDRDNAVANLLGWKDANLDYGASSLMSQLKHYRDEAMQEYLEAEKVSISAKCAEENAGEKKDLAEKWKMVKEYEVLLDKAKGYFREINDEIEKGELSDLRIDQQSAYEIQEEFFTQASFELWVRKKYGRSIIFPAATLESILSLTGISTNEDNNQKPKKQSKLHEQEETILAQIEKLGLDPKTLPPNDSGKKGIKSNVRELLKDDELFAGKSVFNKAWERLSESKLIAFDK